MRRTSHRFLNEEELYPSSEETYDRLARGFANESKQWEGNVILRANYFDSTESIEHAQHNYERYCVHSYLLSAIRNARNFEDFIQSVKYDTRKCDKSIRNSIIATINWMLEDWSNRFIDAKFNYVWADR